MVEYPSQSIPFIGLRHEKQNQGRFWGHLGAQRRQDIHLGRWPFSEAKRTDRQYLDPRMGAQRLPEGLTQNSKK